LRSSELFGAAVGDERLARRRRLDSALRANRGRRLLPDYVAWVGARLGRPIGDDELLDLDATDAVRAQLERRVRALEAGEVFYDCDFVTMQTGSRDVIRKELEVAADMLGRDRMLWLLTDVSDPVPAVGARVDEIVANVFRLLDEKREIVSAGDLAGEHGLELFADTESGHAPLRWLFYAWAHVPGAC
jgi:hypothetical protein